MECSSPDKLQADPQFKAYLRRTDFSVKFWKEDTIRSSTEAVTQFKVTSIIHKALHQGSGSNKSDEPF